LSDWDQPSSDPEAHGLSPAARMQLAENGADVKVIYYEDISGDESDDEEEYNRIKVTPLYKAVRENRIEIAKQLILYVLLNNPREKPDYITTTLLTPYQIFGILR